MGADLRKTKRLAVFKQLLDIGALTGAIALVALYAQTAAILPAPYVPRAESGGMVVTNGMVVTLSAVFIIGLGCVGLLTLVSNFSSFYRPPVKLNARNIQIQYLLFKSALSALKIVFAAYFSIILVKIYRMEIRFGSPEFKIYSWGAAAAAAAIYLIYLLAAVKNK